MKHLKIILFLAVLAGILFYVNLPVLNYGFTGIGVIFALLLVLYILLSMGVTTDASGKNFRVSSKPNVFVLLLFVLVLVYITVLPLLTSAPIFHTSKYQKLIGKVDNGQKFLPKLLLFPWIKFVWLIKS